MACHGRRGLVDPLSVQREPPFGDGVRHFCSTLCGTSQLARPRGSALKNKIHTPQRFSECKSSLQLSSLASARPCLAWGGGLPSDLCTQHCPLPSTKDLISPFVERCRGPCHFSSPLSRLTPPRREKGKCEALWGKRRPGVMRTGATALGAAAVLPLPSPWRRLGGSTSRPSRRESATEWRTKADPRATRSLAGLGRRQPPTEGADTGAGARRSAGFQTAGLRVRSAMLLSQHDFEAPGF